MSDQLMRDIRRHLRDVKVMMADIQSNRAMPAAAYAWKQYASLGDDAEKLLERVIDRIIKEEENEQRELTNKHDG